MGDGGIYLDLLDLHKDSRAPGVRWVFGDVVLLGSDPGGVHVLGLVLLSRLMKNPTFKSFSSHLSNQS